MDQQNLYARRRAEFGREAAEAERSANRISLYRMLTFFGILLSLASFADLPPALSLLALLLSLAGFTALVSRHERVFQRRAHLRRLERIQEQELARQALRLQGLPDGRQFSDPLHAYSADLDLFGPESLFALACRAHLPRGQKQLAAWLLAPAHPDEIRLRQAAVLELSASLDWRHTFEAHGMKAAESGQDPESFLEWLREPPSLLPRQGLLRAAQILPRLSAAALLVALLGLPPALAIAAPLILAQMVINQICESTVAACYKKTARLSRMFRAFSELLADVEGASFQAPLLAALKARLQAQGHPASAWISRMAGLVHALDFRHGMFHFPVNSLRMGDIKAVVALERWKEAAGSSVDAWFDALARLEALSSLASLQGNRADFKIPKLEEAQTLFEARGLGHPLIPADKLVRNDFSLYGRGHIALVTGSNMAGKSTFLRAVGINVVLALAGGPVCAESFRLSFLHLYTSMRASDSLGQGASLFYAELQRLRQTLDAVARGENVLFLLDEILKGTNSLDRHLGSEALLRQLHRLGGAGILATHDLELGSLAAEYSGAIENFCFESEAAGGHLLFDYRLRPGLCQSRNAVTLMRGIGIEIPS